MRDEAYYLPKGIEGVGGDIKWCGRWHGGKRCQLCQHHADFDEWSKSWRWYYLTEWYSEDWAYFGYLNRADWQFYQHIMSISNWYNRRMRKQTEPHRYSSRGLNKSEIRSLFKKGCNVNKKCKCMSIAQRGNWYCPNCFQWIKVLAKSQNCHPHDIMIRDRNNIKEDLLILKLSGIYSDFRG